jgi:hypothetical protein
LAPIPNSSVRLACSVYGVWKLGEEAETCVVRWLATDAGGAQVVAPEGQFTSALGYLGKMAAAAGFMMSRKSWVCVIPLPFSTFDANMAGIRL